MGRIALNLVEDWISLEDATARYPLNQEGLCVVATAAGSMVAIARIVGFNSGISGSPGPSWELQPLKVMADAIEQ